MLVERARAGDREAFAALYVRHHDVVARVCRNWIRDQHLAEDAVQDTFLRAWKALPNFTHDVDLSHWLRRIARNHCRDLWRAGSRRAALTADPIVDLVDPAAEESVVGAVDRVAVGGMLGRLRPRDAELLVEHHAMGISVRALAGRWHLTKGAMEVALHRARQRARRCAEQQGLRGLVPLDALRRTAVWLQRSSAEAAGLSSPAAVALCHLTVAAVALTIPQLAVGHTASGPGHSARHEVVSATDLQIANAVHRGAHAMVVSHDHAGRHHGARAPDPRPAKKAPAGPVTEPAPEPLAEVDPVPVPVAGGHVTPSPSPRWKKVNAIGVRNPITGGNLVGHTAHEQDAEPVKDAHRRSCPVVDQAEPVTYCD